MNARYSLNIASSRMGFAWIHLSVLILCALCGETLAQEFKQVHPGVEYAQVVHKIGEDPVKINLLRLDLAKVRLDVHHALDKAIGLETTSSIAKRKGALAAINAGFFRLDKSQFAGDMSGVLMIDGRLLSESNGRRAALSIFNRATNSNISIGQLEAKFTLCIPNIGELSPGINRQRTADDVVIYTPEFQRSTLTDENGDEYVVTKVTVTSINESRGNTSIPKNGYIVSVSGNRRAQIKAALKPGVKTSCVSASPKKANAEKAKVDITNGIPILVSNGKLDITWEQEKASRSFAEIRHPRTAVAKLKDGKFLMMTVDGRQPGASVGMSLQELAEYLLSLGAVDAMNLDGGGSTTMYLDGKVVNTPSDKEGERKIGDAIVVTLRK
jgi:exopolysaccharide biosynthesis protein